MTRVSAPAPTDRGEARRGARAIAVRWLRAIGAAALFAALVLGLYLGYPIFKGFEMPLGPDGPVYAWWARHAEAAGLDAVRRPGVPALTLVLGPVLGLGATAVVTILGPVLAASSGLAAAGLVESSLGHRPVRTWAAGLFVASFAGFLAPGWLANLSLVVLFLGAAAALALAAWSWRAVGLGSILLAVGGVAHLPFLLVGLAILGGTVVLLAPDAWRRMRAGASATETHAVRLAIGTAAGAAGAFAGLGLLSGGRRAPGDTSQDQFFRRSGLGSFLQERLRERFARETVRLAPVLVTGGLLSAVASNEDDARAARAGYLWSLGAAWAGVTLAGVGILWVTSAAPSSRMLTFAFFLPLAASLGLAAALQRPHRLLQASAVAVALVFVGASLWGWYRQRPYVPPDEVSIVRSAGAAIEELPTSTPLVILVDTRELAAGFHIARFGNVIRMGLPPDRIGDTHLVIGSPSDFLAGRPGTTSDDPEYAQLARAYFDDASGVRSQAVVLVLRPFNDLGYPEARALGNEVAPGVALLRGPRASPTAVAPRPDPGTTGLGAWGLVGGSIGLLLLVALLGGGWARWALPGASRLAVVAVAPSAGLGLSIAGAVTADRAGFGAGPAGIALVLALAVLGYTLALRAVHQAIDPPQEPGG